MKICSVNAKSTKIIGKERETSISRTVVGYNLNINQNRNIFMHTGY